MRIRHLLLLLCLCVYGTLSAVAQMLEATERYPKREFRGAWIQVVNGQFKGMSTDEMKQALIGQLDALREAGIYGTPCSL